MSVNDLVFSADKVQIGIGCSTIPATPGFGELCRNDSLYATDAVTSPLPVGLSVYLEGTGSTWQAVYRGPNEPSGGYKVTGLSGTAGTIDCYLNDYKLYARYDQTWHVVVGSIDIYVNGVLSTTLAGFSATSAAFGPVWVPIFCGLCKITGGGTTTGGWRFYKDGGWHALPIAIPTVADAPTSGIGTDGSFHPIPVTAPFGLAASDALVGASTWGTQVNAFPTPPPSGGPDYDIEGAAGEIILIPNLPKSFERITADFGADFYRGSVPRCYGLSTRGIERTGPGYFKLATFTNSTDIVSASAAAGEEVGSSPGTIEACMSLPTYSVIKAWRNRTRESGTGTIFDVETLTTEYPTHVDSPSATYMDHADLVARYFNSAVCNPHWHFFWTPTPINADGSPHLWEDYGGPSRQQHLITSDRRNHIVSDPLEGSPHTAWLDTYVGIGLRWIGVGRWKTRAATMRTTYTYTSASSSLWSETDCTLTHGTDITVTPTAAMCQVKLKLGAFTIEPYMWPHLADQITVDWDMTNVDDIKVCLEGRNGETVLLNHNDPGTPKARPESTTIKYCWSGVQDYGIDGVTDQGADQDAGGDSLSVYNDPEGVFAARGLADRTAEYLVFEITPTNPSNDVTLKYPKLDYTLAAGRVQKVENGCDQIIVHPAGPGVRVGDWDFYAGGLTNPPLLQGGLGKMTVIDGLCTLRLTAEGLAYNDNLTTELTTLYDTYEGQSVGQVDGYGSTAFLLPEGDGTWRMALVDGTGEVPPLCAFPRGARDTTTWEESTTSFVQKSYVWADPYCTSVASRVAGHVKDPSDVVWSAASGSVIGWEFARHSHALTESESGFKVFQGTNQRGKDWRPWRGFFAVWPPLEATGGIAIAVRSDWRVAVANVGSPASLAFGWTVHTLGAWINAPFDADSLAVAWDFDGSSKRLFLATEESGAIVLRHSDDEGASWSGGMTVAAGPGLKFPAIAVLPGGVLCVYWTTVTEVKGHIYDSSLSPMTSEFTAQASAEQSGLAAAATRGPGGQVKVVMGHIDGGAAVLTESDNGQVFV